MKRKVIAMAAAAAIGLTITAADAFHDFNATSPPRVDFLATPARRLHLGMTAQDVTRVMGDAPRETIFAAEGANIRRLEFRVRFQARLPSLTARCRASRSMPSGSTRAIFPRAAIGLGQEWPPVP